MVLNIVATVLVAIASFAVFLVWMDLRFPWHWKVPAFWCVAMCLTIIWAIWR